MPCQKRILNLILIWSACRGFKYEKIFKPRNTKDRFAEPYHATVERLSTG